jgi:hypothetical protein
MKMYIARDQGKRDIEGALFLYVNKPTSHGGIWYGGETFYTIDNRLFPEVTFENSPQEVELKLIEK